ncbi:MULTISPECIES: hypothetical protein [Bacillaceae]|uniref:hypothetical protein n=1 Tax=Bacillaceae TaxID=186817 RepID=UPI0005A8E29A|nr:hypothetical protein [Bacillus rubiinfantis]
MGNKRGFAHFLLLLCLLGMVIWPANRHTEAAISDGNATGAGFNPFVVDAAVKQNWKKTKGGKEHLPGTGRKLVYDVYSGASSDPLKQSWNITKANKGRGTESFLQFYGWSAIEGRQHHSQDNQATYIVAVNERTRKEVIVKTEMTNLDAGKDMEFGKTSAGGPINNLCASSVRNAPSDVCNMEYKWVGFKAWLPLDELFPNPDKEENWILYILKNIDGHIVYDELIMPFAFDRLDFLNGELSLESGKDTNKLKMNVSSAIRRSVPRGVNPNENGKYFTLGQTYQRVEQDESTGVAVWYGVRSPHDGNAVRWTSSSYWTFGGATAKLSYRFKEVDVTIRHVDADTGKILGTEKDKVIINHEFEAKPKPSGHFKDKDGNLYIPSPANQNFKGIIKKETTLDFTYRRSLPDPSKNYEEKGMTPGRADGIAYWELRRNDQSRASDVAVSNQFNVTGKHYAVRNEKHQIDFAGRFIEQKRPIEDAEAGMRVKGEPYKYGFSYEYTNFYYDHYICVEQQGKDCFKWQFKERTPAWELGKTFAVMDTFTIDHRQGDTLSLPTLEDALNQKLLVGQEDRWNGTAKLSRNDFFERWRKAENSRYQSEYVLKTQSTIPVSVGGLIYEVSLPSGLQLSPAFHPMKRQLSAGYFFPPDIDDSLKNDYRNTTSYTEYKYMFPLQQSIMNDRGGSGNTRSFNMDYVGDFFFMGKHTGYVVGYPNAKAVKDAILANKESPSFSQMANEGKTKLFLNFKHETGYSLEDDVLYTDTDSKTNRNKLQRYLLPVSADSILHPGEKYQNHYILSNMGLSDVSIRFNQSFQFERYLFGSGADDAWMIEQVESRVPVNTEEIHTVLIKYEDLKRIAAEEAKRPKERVHKFRLLDRSFKDKIADLFH